MILIKDECFYLCKNYNSINVPLNISIVCYLFNDHVTVIKIYIHTHTRFL